MPQIKSDRWAGYDTVEATERENSNVSRQPVPAEVQTQLLVRSRRRCCLCVYLEDDRRRKRVQIAHIDRDPRNAKSENLVPLCLDHHDEYDSTTSQSKGMLPEELRVYKKMWFGEVEHTAMEDVQYRVVFRMPANPSSLSASFFYAYGVLFADIRNLLNLFDPMGLMGCGAPADEYDPETHDIISRRQVAGTGSAPTIAKCVFEDWFSEDLLVNYGRWGELGDKIESAWLAFESRTVVFEDLNTE